MVLELTHMNDISVSAFTLNRVRYARDRSFHQRLAALAEEGEVATKEALLRIREALPPFPRNCLQLSLSDGTHELKAIELERLDVQLGRTPMGVKVCKELLVIWIQEIVVVIFTLLLIADPPPYFCSLAL